MTDDPIVEEVHRARAKLIAEHDGSLPRYLESLRQQRGDKLTGASVRNVEELRRKTAKLAS